MNKILISVLAVVGIAGGGYYFITQEHIDTVASYLPESISSLISIKTPVEEMQTPSPMPKQNIAVQHDVQKTPVVNNKPIAPPVVNEVVVNEQNIQVKTRISDSEKEAALIAVKMIDAKTKSDPDQSVEINASQDAPDGKANISINVGSQQATKVEKKPVTLSVKTKAAPEVLKLENELRSVQKDVMQVDGENKMLQARFQKILKKNRDLALKLKRINDKIQVAN